MMQQLRLRQLGARVLGTTLQQRFEGQRIRDAALWLGLSLLLLLSDYGTNFSLVLSVGIVALAYFGLLFWFVDRVRRRVPQPILPTTYETSWVLSSFAVLTLVGMTALFQSAERPGLTLVSVLFFSLCHSYWWNVLISKGAITT
ncbi:MAG: hypothetical protein BRC36_12665 [Cyanobacteria bacterium QH_2_48_84]|nr:MAG: hypothetical protein BRC36_12665 [Cyanobacteria bacterium QH_2_48_84]PSO72552.1 MAG: hypothetical protein BRC37_11310 [Cyanobacteria bacterium QH_3_48_40]